MGSGLWFCFLVYELGFVVRVNGFVIRVLWVCEFVFMNYVGLLYGVDFMGLWDGFIWIL